MKLKKMIIALSIALSMCLATVSVTAGDNDCVFTYDGTVTCKSSIGWNEGRMPF